jgi:hypothetical protein
MSKLPIEVAVIELTIFVAECKEPKCGWFGNQTISQELAEQEADIHEADHIRRNNDPSRI